MGGENSTSLYLPGKNDNVTLIYCHCSSYIDYYFEMQQNNLLQFGSRKAESNPSIGFEVSEVKLHN